MHILIKKLRLILFLPAMMLVACYTEDPGSMQETEQQFAVAEFSRLKIGSALQVDVLKGDAYRVIARGDKRNVDDLEVKTENGVLSVYYNKIRSRKHRTSIEITMPALLYAELSGASDSRITGFNSQESFGLDLSGASVCRLQMDAKTTDVKISGASDLKIHGSGDVLHANISGASALNAFNFPVTTADIVASGASDGRVAVSEQLHIVASGASVISYHGNPSLNSRISGASTVRKD